MENLGTKSNSAVPKLALNRVEAAQAIGVSPATLDRLAQRGLIRPCRATYRPIYWLKELERFLKDNSAADYIPCSSLRDGLPGQRAKQPKAGFHPRNNFPGVPPSATGNEQKMADRTKDY